MNPERPFHQGRLRRLSPGFYRGLAWVHWTMNLAGRATGLLDPLHHARLRERLCHALAREDLVCSAYCLMPDHAHFLIGGLREDSDQLKGVKAFRKAWNHLLESASPPVALALQAHDHVLTDEERGPEEFETVRGYIWQNPVRGKRVESWRDWEYSGCLMVGYPDLDPREEDFHERFWRIYHLLVEEHANQKDV
jgi:hypothetical protein